MAMKTEVKAKRVALIPRRMMFTHSLKILYETP